MVRRTRDSDSDEHWPTNKEAWNESSQSYRGLSSVQNPRCLSCPKFPERSPPTHRWLVLGRWDGASCRVCVCVFQLGLAEIEVVNGTYWEFSSSSEVHRRKRISPVGWRGAPRNSWGQRTPRGLAGARCLWVAPTNPHGGRSNDSRVLHPRQSEERHLRLLQLDIVVFGNVIVIVFLRLLLSGWEALYCIWLTLT